MQYINRYTCAALYVNDSNKIHASIFLAVFSFTISTGKFSWTASTVYFKYVWRLFATMAFSTDLSYKWYQQKYPKLIAPYSLPLTLYLSLPSVRESPLVLCILREKKYQNMPKKNLLVRDFLLKFVQWEYNFERRIQFYVWIVVQ